MAGENNPYFVAPVNPMQALMAGEQGYKEVSGIVKERQVGAAREQAAQELMNGGNPQNAIARLMSIGDMQGVHTIAGISQNNRDFQFRQQESQRSQGNADRAFGLQERTANEAARGFDYREVDDGNGGKTFVKVNKATGQVEKVDIAGAAGTPNNPFAYGKQNENQGKDSGYANRMFQSEKVLRDQKLAEASQSLIDRAADRILPGDVANKFVTSEGYQKYDQAARDFINATLRRESGAAISQSEFDNAYKQYLPRPGDSKELLKQKQQNRQATIASIAGGGGPSYKPPYSFTPDGEMVATGNSAQGVVAAKGAPPPPAIEALKANPKLRTAFEAKYGPGSAAAALGQ